MQGRLLRRRRVVLRRVRRVANDGERRDGRRGPAALGELLHAHADAVADAVLERFAAGQGPDGAPDAATLRNLRLGARAAVDASWPVWPTTARRSTSRCSTPTAARSRPPAARSPSYRLKTLRELLGDALDDPDERFELALALRVTRD